MKESAQTVVYMNHQGNVNVKCTCKNFEACGWLCCHCLRIPHNHSISKIPEKYILHRWTKCAKKDVWEKMFNNQVPHNKDNDNNQRLLALQWRHNMGRKMYNLVLKAQHNNNARRVVEDLCHKAYEEVQRLQEESIQEQTSQTNISKASLTVLDPDKSVTKGRKKRIKGHFEKKKNTTNKEFGCTTPKKQII